MKKQEKYLAEEWFRQANYDLDTAHYLFNGGRYIYTVFVCHLSIEKALKGIYILQTEELPPKLHSLDYLIKAVKLKDRIPENFLKFIVELDRWNVPTRYPESLFQLQKLFTKSRTKEIINKTDNVLKWLLSNK